MTDDLKCREAIALNHPYYRASPWRAPRGDADTISEV
jgi:hypothetical protein